MESTEISEQTKNKPKRGRPAAKAVLISALVALLVIAGATGGYYKYHKTSSELRDVNAKLSASQSANKKLKDDKTSLTKAKNEAAAEATRGKAEIERLNQSIKELTDTKTVLPTMKVVAAKHFNGTPNQYNAGTIIIDGKNDFLLVQVELTNQSKKDTYFSLGDLKLKDDKDVTQPYFTEASTSGWSGAMGASSANGFLPDGYQSIANQVLKPGETVRGGLIWVGSASIKTAKLSYGDNTYNITF